MTVETAFGIGFAVGSGGMLLTFGLTWRHWRRQARAVVAEETARSIEAINNHARATLIEVRVQCEQLTKGRVRSALESSPAGWESAGDTPGIRRADDVRRGW